MQNLNAVLARLSISQFNNTRDDDTITAEVKTLHQLTGRAGRWVKLKLPAEALEGVRRQAAHARQEHYRLTLPWEEGYRLLTLPARAAYQERHDRLAAEFQDQVERFIQLYPEHILAARGMHNGTFNAADYPPAEEARRMFAYRVEYTPVPQAGHFVSTVAGPALDHMQTQLAAANERRVEEAVRDCWQRLLAPVRALATKLTDPEAIFRDSLVSNVGDILELVPSLNLLNDATLTTAAGEIKAALASLQAEDLRTSRVIRRTAAEAAGAIVRKFGALGVRKF